MLEIGAEAARKRLPELLDRAHAGEQTIVKKHGIPYAAIVAYYCQERWFSLIESYRQKSMGQKFK